MKPTKHGFTLVELSIVLVIIGLLIGGLLVGQSIIDSARVNRLVNDLRQYEVATVQFQKKFKYYPGDSAFFTPPGLPNNVLAYGGTGSGFCAAAPNSTLYNIESTQFFAHLSQSQMLKTNYSPRVAAICAGTDNSRNSAPYIKIGTSYNLITPGKPFAWYNLSLQLSISVSDVAILENKLSAQSDGGTGKQLGLVNFMGLGNCIGDDGDGGQITVLCSDPGAIASSLGYYIAP